MKSLTTVAFLLLVSGSIAQSTTTAVPTNCVNDKTDTFCNTGGLSGYCCAQIVTSVKATAAGTPVNTTYFQCIPAELGKFASTVTLSALQTSTYQCVSTSVADPATCSSNDDCDAGTCCASRNASYAISTGTNFAVTGTAKVCTTQNSNATLATQSYTWTFRNTTGAGNYPTSTLIKQCAAQNMKTSGVFLRVSAVILALIAVAFY
ncbi:UNKNOWN [Stylonychia lemnae]|uniref:Uncharacterized protein n=1 Tax=Stylonychia lemnae TaxID=5949 RepID=A0A078AJZ7_STYLE|nr:UNKNOWN [Stylonychia lemnae]|eukprot:CDW81128.1 UNKNOWN [Stylonychia lemnae]